MVNQDVDGYTTVKPYIDGKYWKKRKNNNNLLKTKRMLKRKLS